MMYLCHALAVRAISVIKFAVKLYSDYNSSDFNNGSRSTALVRIFISQCCSPADSGLDLDLRCIENVLTDYDSQHLQT